VLLLAVVNYQPNTWLTGWDNIHPEFNFQINLERHLTASWQEYQGTGLPAAMGHAADVPRLIVLALLDVFLPTNMVRYSFMFLLLFFGSVGFYQLSRWLITNSKRVISPEKINLYSFLGALFFIFNLGTLQQFYTPISMFPTQWAFFPWLFLFLFRALKSGGKKNYTIFFFLSFFAAPMAYTPTLYVVYAVAIAIICLISIAQNLKNRALLSGMIRKVAILFVLTIAANGFWLFSFLNFYSANGAGTVIDSQMNQMFSLDSYAQNRAGGGLENVTLLKGFWFLNEDYFEETDTFEPLMRDWTGHVELLPVKLIGYAFFGLVLVGLVYSYRIKLPNRSALAILFGLALFILLNSNPPFGFLFDFLRENSSVFSEALRFPFTKLSSLATLLYAIFFTIGLLVLDSIPQKLIKMGFSWLIALTVVFALGLFNLPSFSGQFISPGVKQNIPDAYFQVFEFFENQPREARIANIPQDRFWAWYHYEWGYRGSGFIWYGVRQPVLDRAFDVWSSENEDYYNQISQAIYTEDYQLVEEILAKYQVGWLVYDDSMRLLDGLEGKQKKFYRENFIPAITARGNFELVGEFGHIKVIAFKPVIDNPGFLGGGKEITSKSLVSNQGAFESALKINEKNQIVYEFETAENSRITVPRYQATENYLPWRIESGKISPVLPIVEINELQVAPANNNRTLDVARQRAGGMLLASSIDIQPADENGYLFTNSNENSLDVYNYQVNADLLTSITSDLALKSANCAEQNASSEHKVEKFNEIAKLASKNASACIFSNLVSDDSTERVFKVEVKHLSTDTAATPRYCALSDLKNDCIKLSRSSSDKQGITTTDVLWFKAGKGEKVNFHLVLDAGEVTKELDVLSIDYATYLRAEGKINLAGLSSSAASSWNLEKGDRFAVSYPQISGAKFSDKVLFDGSAAFNICALQRASSVVEQSTLDMAANSETGSGVNPEVTPGLKLTVNHTEACWQKQYADMSAAVNYLLVQDSKFISGYPLRFCAANYAYNSCHKEFLSSSKSGPASRLQIIPRFGTDKTQLGWNLNISSRSRGNFPSVNELTGVEFSFYPFDFVKGIELTASSQGTSSDLQVTNMRRITPFWYQAEVEGSGTLALKQAYNEGWRVFGADTRSHQTYQGWANSWQIATDPATQGKTAINILYVPQIYEVIGQILFLLTAYGLYSLWFLRRKMK
jgi:hypothetical protein